MASKKELERRIRWLEASIELLEKYVKGLRVEIKYDTRIKHNGTDDSEVYTYAYLRGSETVPTIRGKLDAIIEHLGIEVAVKESAEKIVVRKLKK